MCLALGQFFWGHRLQPEPKTKLRAVSRTTAAVDCGVDNDSNVCRTSRSFPEKPRICSTPFSHVISAAVNTQFDLVAGIINLRLDKVTCATARLQVVTSTGEELQVRSALLQAVAFARSSGADVFWCPAGELGLATLPANLRCS